MSAVSEPVAETCGPGSNAFDVERIRGDFPILARAVHGRRLVYLDNAATSQKPQVVIDAVGELVRVDRMPDAVVVGLLVQDSQVKVLAGEETQHRLGDIVIHDRVELITLQPAL